MSNVDPARMFIVGETVDIEVRVSLPGTKTPTDPALVELAELKLGTTDVTPSPATFTRLAEGDYLYVIHTTSLDPGTYSVLTRVSDGADKIVLVPDSFVLQSVP